ncbi:MAG: ribonuclease HII, partial [Oscillospiraceae bacterium]|nr:ribonuclease HII [Oscillospiraceae bacterium]
AAAVILPRHLLIPGLNDSKTLTERRREVLYDQITQQAVAWAVARVEASEIDATDILSARMKAMQLAIDALSRPADAALIDGNRDAGRAFAITTPHRCVVGGDGKSASIAAASVLAKVSRDRYVTEVLDRRYPQYQFARHKGYGTRLHYALLDQYGPCPEHRLSFLKKWRAEK